ncbi:MAG: hypothetical protein M1832_004328 [Thelocarpon impressellum]|nr:MAG: hypothetical protein M1832_004328 [Thelocarpon impressellum]
MGKKAGDESVFKCPPRPLSSSQQVGHGSLSRQDPEDLPTEATGTTGVTEKADSTPEDVQDGEPVTGQRPRRPRPSLSERTIETLSLIPPSPSPRRRTSAFFSTESPMRPSSAMNGPSLRPGSSLADRREAAGADVSFASPTKRSFAGRSSLAGQAVPTSRSRQSNASLTGAAGKARASIGPDQDRQQPAPPPKLQHGSKSLSMRPPRPRPSIAGLASRPASHSPDKPKPTPAGQATVRPRLSTSTLSSSKPSASVKAPAKAPLASSTNPQAGASKASKSSMALRETIAKAKAARQPPAQKMVPDMTTAEPSGDLRADGFEFDLPPGPGQGGNKGLLRKRVDAARTDGRLNIAAMGLKEVPDEVMKMYDLEAVDTSGPAWYESVDLIRFVAADNELEVIAPEIFPDLDARDLDDEDKGNQFGGVECIDLHRNQLIKVPLGLQRLERLTVLNLSNNRLGNGCLGIISGCRGLRELRLASNGLERAIPEQIGSLGELEVLDLRDNMVTALPESLAELTRLRILNLADNGLKSLPFAAFASMPLAELIASKNDLRGTLIPRGVDKLASLQTLDVAGNALEALSEAESLSLPALQQLHVSSNRMTSLPAVSDWTELLVLAAEDNKLSTFPEGFASLKKVKNVDFTGNNIRSIDDRVGAMESLHVLRLANNPLRERRFLTMPTEDLKAALKRRFAPEVDDEDESPSEQGDDAPHGTTGTPTWPVRPGGLVDLRSSKLSTLPAAELEATAAKETIRGLELKHNLLTMIPQSLALVSGSLTSLSLAQNKLSSSFLVDPCLLPHLQTLNLSGNGLTTLEPLTAHLTAPKLDTLDVSCNGLTQLPALKRAFPALSTLLASDNAIAELTLEAARGLRALNLQNNNLDALNPRLGLLEGLQMLEVRGNRFRVPGWRVLEQGTTALKEWLKGRVPAEELDGDGEGEA